MLPGEPQGWSYLQAMAQRERDPNRLMKIIDRMNRLLDEHEGRSSGDIRARKSLSVVQQESISE